MAESLLSHVRRHSLARHTYVVGGAVRDRLLGRPIIDWDLVVPSDPQTMAKDVARRLGGSAFTLDAERGIWRVTGPGGHFDLARQQGDTIEIDLARRDFTVNAIAVPLLQWDDRSWRNAQIDPFRGRADLQKRKIRILNNGVFREDPVRLFRAFRIAAELDFSLSPDTVTMIRKEKRRISSSAPERVREEWLKLFSTTRSYPMLMAMERHGFLESLLPEVRALRRTAPAYYGAGGVLTHTLRSVFFFEQISEKISSWFPKHAKKIRAYLAAPLHGYPRSAHLKWGLLLHDIGKPETARKINGRLRFFEHEHAGADRVPDIGARFRWSTDEINRCQKLVRNHMRPGNLATHETLSDKAIHRFFRDLGDDGVGMLLVSLADHLTYLSPAQRKRRNSAHETITRRMIRRFYDHHERVLPPRLVTGHDVMKAFRLDPSPLIGALLTDAVEAQAEGRISTKEEAIAYLKSRVSLHAPADAKKAR